MANLLAAPAYTVLLAPLVHWVTSRGRPLIKTVMMDDARIVHRTWPGHGREFRSRGAGNSQWEPSFPRSWSRAPLRQVKTVLDLGPELSVGRDIKYLPTTTTTTTIITGYHRKLRKEGHYYFKMHSTVFQNEVELCPQTLLIHWTICDSLPT